MEKDSRRILKAALEHWHEDFTGISATSIATELSLPHDRVLAILDGFENEGLGNIRRDVKLYQIDIKDPFGSDPVDEIQTVIFFPSPTLLAKDFFARKLHKRNLPEYKKRLHMGG